MRMPRVLKPLMTSPRTVTPDWLSRRPRPKVEASVCSAPLSTTSGPLAFVSPVKVVCVVASMVVPAAGAGRRSVGLMVKTPPLKFTLGPATAGIWKVTVALTAE